MHIFGKRRCFNTCLSEWLHCNSEIKGISKVHLLIFATQMLFGIAKQWSEQKKHDGHIQETQKELTWYRKVETLHEFTETQTLHDM